MPPPPRCAYKHSKLDGPRATKEEGCALNDAFCEEARPVDFRREGVTHDHHPHPARLRPRSQLRDAARGYARRNHAYGVAPSRRKKHQRKSCGRKRSVPVLRHLAAIR
eukprot:6209257-Pleurochrysis_carterae.AAC.2